MPSNYGDSCLSFVGQYNEEGLKRIDLILSEAQKQHVKVILTLGNFEPQFGGIQWYVDQAMGKGHNRENFYTNDKAKMFYKQYITTLVRRTNTFKGTQYKDDTTILSWELLNEPHTTDLFEKKKKTPPGKLVRDWLSEMSGWLKGIDPNHLISSGEEGYRADGDTSLAHNDWINRGYKGETPTSQFETGYRSIQMYLLSQYLPHAQACIQTDGLCTNEVVASGVDFVGNIHLPHIDFATVHVYPGIVPFAVLQAQH